MIKCGAIKFCFPIKHDKLFKLKEAFFEIIRIVVSVKENSSGSDGKKKKKKKTTCWDPTLSTWQEIVEMSRGSVQTLKDINSEGYRVLS